MLLCIYPFKETDQFEDKVEHFVPCEQNSNIGAANV